eukprot:5281044-Prymnesium_polylepis.2
MRPCVSAAACGVGRARCRGVGDERADGARLLQGSHRREQGHTLEVAGRRSVAPNTWTCKRGRARGGER